MKTRKTSDLQRVLQAKGFVRYLEKDHHRFLSMRNRSGYLLILLCATWAGGHRTQAQTCGGGTRIVKVRYPNGQLVDSLRYEVLAIPDYYGEAEDSLEAFRNRRRHGAPHYSLNNYLNTVQQGVLYGQKAMVPLDSADVRYLQGKQLLAPVSERDLDIDKFVPAGSMLDGICRFKTYEGGGGGAIFVLKLTAPNRQLYLISQLFTGCGNQPFVVIWGRAPHLQVPPVSWQEADEARQKVERQRAVDLKKLQGH